MSTVLTLYKNLLKFGTHTGQCRYRGGHDCDCGWEEARAEAKKEIEKREKITKS